VLVDSTIFTIGITQPRKFVKQYLQLANPKILQERDGIDRFLQRFDG